MLRRLVPAGIALLAALALQPAAGATITYTSRATFLTATGATSATGALPNSGAAPSVTVGAITFSAVAPTSTDIWLAAWTTRISGFDIAIQGVENFNAQSASLVTAMGFDFVEPQFDPNVNAAFLESTFSVAVYNGATLVDSVSFSRGNDSLQFFGIATDLLFNRMEIRETTGGAENEFFGQFYTNAAVVPVPAALPLFGLALASLSAVRRRARP